MEHLVNLDAVAVELDRRRPEWRTRGLMVEAFTWRDGAVPWPHVITTDRSSVQDAESLGVTFRSLDGKEADLVLWAGGWADMNGSINGEIVYLFPDFSDVTSCVSATEALVNRLGPPK